MEANPISTSPLLALLLSIIFVLSTTPTEKPARSKLLVGKLPGCSAVSPPTNEHPACLQPSAIPPAASIVSQELQQPTQLTGESKLQIT